MAFGCATRSIYQQGQAWRSRIARCPVMFASVSRNRKKLENPHGLIKLMDFKSTSFMAHQSTESKRLLSHTIAEWACGSKYEDLSPEAIQAAKLFWFDSIGCALGGSQQEDAKILLEHHRAMAGGNGKATAFVSGFKTNPVDASFLNGHMIRAMD